MRMRIKGRVILQADCEPRVPLLREDSTCEVCVLSQSPSLGIQAHENRGAGEMNLYRQLSETGEMRDVASQLMPRKGELPLLLYPSVWISIILSPQLLLQIQMVWRQFLLGVPFQMRMLTHPSLPSQLLPALLAFQVPT